MYKVLSSHNLTVIVFKLLKVAYFLDREELLHLRNMMDAANKALLEYTPVESIANVDALREFLQVSKNQLEVGGGVILCFTSLSDRFYPDN